MAAGCRSAGCRKRSIRVQLSQDAPGCRAAGEVQGPASWPAGRDRACISGWPGQATQVDGQASLHFCPGRLWHHTAIHRQKGAGSSRGRCFQVRSIWTSYFLCCCVVACPTHVTTATRNAQKFEDSVGSRRHCGSHRRHTQDRQGRGQCHSHLHSGEPAASIFWLVLNAGSKLQRHLLAHPALINVLHALPADPHQGFAAAPREVAWAVRSREALQAEVPLLPD